MDEGGGFVKSWVLKRISNIQHQCPMSKFEDEDEKDKGTDQLTLRASARDMYSVAAPRRCAPAQPPGSAAVPAAPVAASLCDACRRRVQRDGYTER